jgi:hypothetical protein
MIEQLPRVFRIAAQEHEERETYEAKREHFNPLLVTLKHLYQVAIIICIYNQNGGDNKHDILGLYHFVSGYI